MNRRISIYLVAVIAFAAPFSLLLSQKDSPLTFSGISRERAIQLAKGKAGPAPNGFHDIIAIRTTWGRVEDAMETGAFNSRERAVWLVSMKGQVPRPMPPRMSRDSPNPPNPPDFDNALVVMDAYNGDTIMIVLGFGEQFVLPAS